MRRKRKRDKKAKIIIEIVLIGIAIFSFTKFALKKIDYKKAEAVYSEIESIMFDSVSTNVEDSILLKEELRVKYNKMIGINKDYIGWINIPETNINYPIVSSKDNEEYLFKDFKGNKNSSGTIFLDYRNTLDDFNIMIHGHNMKNSTMFNNLVNFKNKDFFEKNKKIEIITKDEKRIYEVFSVYVVKVEEDYLREEYSEEYINYMKEKSIYKEDIKINENSEIITLSTCSYEFDDARTVIHGVRVE